MPAWVAAAAGGGRSDKPIVHGGGTRGIHFNLCNLAPRLHPHLAVIDGFEGMENTGPVNGTPIDHRVCVVSMDWLAADTVAAELMGLGIAKVGYLTYCAAAAMGQADLAKIEILGPALKDHIKVYKEPANMDPAPELAEASARRLSACLEYRCYKRINTIRGELDTIYNSE